MDQKFIQYENHNFNATHIASLTKEDFVAQNKGNHFKRLGDKEDAKLGEVWDICTASVKEVVPDASAESTVKQGAKAASKASQSK